MCEQEINENECPHNNCGKCELNMLPANNYTLLCKDNICMFKKLTNKIQYLEEKLKWYDHYKESALQNKDLCNEASIKRDIYLWALEKIEKIITITFYENFERNDILRIIKQAKELTERISYENKTIHKKK